MIIEQKRLQNACILEDGRKLVYDIYGAMEGTPYFYFHGYPSSRIEASCIHEKAEEKNIKIIAVDRPGIGLSDFQKNRKIVDWAEDVSELANELGFMKFGVMGMSSGAPYALACGYKIPEKLNKIVLISALGGVDFKQPGLKNDHKAAFRVAGSLPFVYRFLLWLCRIRHIKGKNAAKKYFRINFKHLALKDQELLQNPDILDAVVEFQYESCRKGLKGLVYEAKLLGRPWGMNLSTISSNLKIYLWHGTADLVAPVTASKEIERMLPKSIADYKEDEGHFSLLFYYHPEILEVLQKTER